jgi:hypothetical protein
MRISGVTTRLSADNQLLYFKVLATASIPADATAQVTVNYEYTPEKPEGSELPDSEFETRLVSSIKPLQGVTVKAKSLEGFINVSDITEKLFESYFLDTSFSDISIKLEEAVIPKPPINNPDREIKEPDDIPTVTNVRRVWMNHSYQGRNEFWITSAYLDLANAVTVDIDIPQKFAFPGIYNPQQITQEAFDALLVAPKADLVEQNGKIFAVKSTTGLKRIAILFTNSLRTYAQYFTYAEVYQLTLPSDIVFSKSIVSQDIVKVKDSTVTLDTGDLDLTSQHFAVEINDAMGQYRNIDVAFDRRTLSFRSDDPSFSLQNSGTTETYFQ